MDKYHLIHIRDIIKVDLDDFIIMMSATESNIAYWADGVLFACFSMTESEELAKKEIAGETYIERVVFSKNKLFSRTIKSATNFELPVVNVQKSVLYGSLIKWIKNQQIWDQE